MSAGAHINISVSIQSDWELLSIKTRSRLHSQWSWAVKSHGLSHLVERKWFPSGNTLHQSMYSRLCETRMRFVNPLPAKPVSRTCAVLPRYSNTASERICRKVGCFTRGLTTEALATHWRSLGTRRLKTTTWKGKINVFPPKTSLVLATSHLEWSNPLERS